MVGLVGWVVELGLMGRLVVALVVDVVGLVGLVVVVGLVLVDLGLVVVGLVALVVDLGLVVDPLVLGPLPAATAVTLGLTAAREALKRALVRR